MKNVVFACVHNAGRSQIAAAFFNAFCAPALVRAISAGTSPSERVHPEVVQVMGEIGFDLSREVPRLLTPQMFSCAEILITLGCSEQCPSAPKVRREDWMVVDPKGQSLDAVRAIRDDLRRRVWKLLAKEGWYKLQPVSVVRDHTMPMAAG